MWVCLQSSCRSKNTEGAQRLTNTSYQHYRHFNTNQFNGHLAIPGSLHICLMQIPNSLQSPQLNTKLRAEVETWIVQGKYCLSELFNPTCWFGDLFTQQYDASLLGLDERALLRARSSSEKKGAKEARNQDRGIQWISFHQNRSPAKRELMCWDTLHTNFSWAPELLSMEPSSLVPQLTWDPKWVRESD